MDANYGAVSSIELNYNATHIFPWFCITALVISRIMESLEL
jgi:hypothetical protein